MRIRSQSLLDNKSWRVSWCIDIWYDSNGKQGQTPAKLLSSDTSAVTVPVKKLSWLTLPVRELLCPTAFLHAHPSPGGGVMIPNQPLSWQQAMFPLPLQNWWQQLPSGARANKADGSGEGAGTSKQGCWNWTSITSLGKRTRGLSPTDSALPWSISLPDGEIRRDRLQLSTKTG